eukprot:c16185_g1_i1.p1 GENE.c16185_g1_i1~~c16185_g1_i1.p1  ORF type:complete len:329 (+),score=101.91 c16185_g1_i1:48-989(+)
MSQKAGDSPQGSPKSSSDDAQSNHDDAVANNDDNAPNGDDNSSVASGDQGVAPQAHDAVADDANQDTVDDTNQGSGEPETPAQEVVVEQSKDEIALVERLGATKTHKWTILPPATDSSATMLQEISTARLAKLLSISTKDREHAQHVTDDIALCEQTISRVREILQQSETVIDEARQVREGVVQQVPQLRTEVFIMQQRIDEDRMQVVKMKQRVAQAEAEQRILNNEMVGWRKLATEWEGDVEQKKLMFERIKSEHDQRKSIVTQSKSQIQDDRRETRKIAEEMGDLTVSVGIDELNLDLDSLTVEAMDGTVY